MLLLSTPTGTFDLAYDDPGARGDGVPGERVKYALVEGTHVMANWQDQSVCARRPRLEPVECLRAMQSRSSTQPLPQPLEVPYVETSEEA